MASLAPQDLSLQHVTNILWAYAVFAWHDARGFPEAAAREVLQRVQRKNEQLSSQQICNLLWALAIMQVSHHRSLP